jgi:hypothetical protein
MWLVSNARKDLNADFRGSTRMCANKAFLEFYPRQSALIRENPRSDALALLERVV